MKLLVKYSFTIFLMLCMFSISYAQNKKRAPYNAVVFTDAKEKVFGKITAITESGITLVNKKDIATNVKYEHINRIKVYKYRGDVGYSIATGALAVGAIVAAQSIDDSNAAMAVGIGGTVGIVALSMALHNVIHGPEIKMEAKKEKIDYNSVNSKLAKYIVTDTALKP